LRHGDRSGEHREQLPRPVRPGHRPLVGQESAAKNQRAGVLIPGSLAHLYRWSKVQSKAVDGSGAAPSFSSARISSMATCKPSALAAPVADQLDAAISELPSANSSLMPA